MVPELRASTTDCNMNVASEQPVVGSLPSKKSQAKAPKKAHKAEREKLKRDQLNGLFLELGRALEPAPRNNGKACILDEATRILRDLILRVEGLRKESATLLTESRYVMVEKDELKDENLALAAEIARLNTELQERQKSDDPTRHKTDTDPALCTQTPVAPLYVLPFSQDLQPLSEAVIAPSSPKPTTQVRRPHARYPTPSDSWPLQVLSRHQHSSSSSSSNSGDEGSEEA
ncbi:uncharacterized protein A4U43_C03F790 [Asparagus officinalis]|uniref:BHLH domain-containing protein n=1 Tax=Asparagus officinalis TaxID=4686 RepID=A0A5P1F691_ASPOF|nr:transcription factor bHLH47-like [Asparagus officinalis]ONK73905.1 uncharacterized protein A4U43_C03F790 [Asparagus officinalis]